MLIHDLEKKKLIHPPKFLADNTHFLCTMGSVAYGVSNDSSDQDVYGFVLPPLEDVFPHLRGEIIGFGNQKQRFEQWSEHHIKTLDGKKEYDFTVYSIVKFFQLCMENNPNMCDALFVPQRCVIHSTSVGQHVRDNRGLFLHKGSFHKFRGYAFKQMAKIRTKQNSKNEQRAADIEKFGYSTKFAYHVVRLALESEQILTEHTLDLERNSEILKSVRRGEWKIEDIEAWFTEKERSLETVYANSTLRHSPDEQAIKTILLECLEMHYGSLDKIVKIETPMDQMLREIEAVVDRYKGR